MRPSDGNSEEGNLTANTKLIMDISVPAISSPMTQLNNVCDKNTFADNRNDTENALSPLHLEESWSKKSDTNQQKSKSKYFNPPVRKLNFDTAQTTYPSPQSFEFRAFSCPGWGGKVQIEGKVITLQNTCPIDNILFLIFVIQSTRPDLEIELRNMSLESVRTLMKVMDEFKKRNWSEGKRIWLEELCGFQQSNRQWDVWGSEDVHVLTHLDIMQQHSWLSLCSDNGCPSKTKIRKSRSIVPSPVQSNDEYSLQDALSEWEKTLVTLCDVKVQKSSSNHYTKSIYDENGKWIENETINLCDGIRTESDHKFVLKEPPIVFIKIDTIRDMLEKKGLPDEIKILGVRFTTVGVTSLHASHITAQVKDVGAAECSWYLYDGLFDRRIRKIRKVNFKNADHLICMKTRIY